MGSVGSFDAQVSIEKKTSIKLDKENSSEEIQEFINRNKHLLVEKKGYGEVKAGQTLLGVQISDESYYEEFEVTLDEPVDVQTFLSDKLYEDNEEIVGFMDEWYSDPKEHWVFLVEAKGIKNKLKDVDLKVVEENIGDWSFDDRYYLTDSEHLASTSGWIYCYNDNSETDTFRVTQEFIDNLKPGDIIRLDANGDGEHC